MPRPVHVIPRAGAHHVLRLGGPVVVLALAVAACGSSGGSSTPGRPHTPARLAIVAPTPNQVTGPDVTVQLTLRGARLAPGTQISGGAQPRKGHIHLSVDGQLYSMTDTLRQDIRALDPGVHTVQAEFVAADHLPFANRVVAAVSFRVAP